jgi:pseudaminic acid synthase
MGKNGRDTLKIGDRLVGKNQPPFIIAEMSGNHNQSLEKALSIVEAAAAAGAHAIKIQTYTADTLTIDSKNPDFYINDPESLWKGETLYSLYMKAYTPWEWHKPIFDRCKELNIIGFSSAFDETAVDFLEELDVQAYKIASFENNHLPLIKKAAATGKPLLISTGMASISDLEAAVGTAREAGNDQLILFKCTSTYPASPADTNLRTIPHLKAMFGTEVGLSDHTLGIGVAISSIAMGAVAIEKHFTISRLDGGVDSAFSIEPGEMKNLVEESLRSWQAIGDIHYGISEKEKGSMKFRRSVYVVEDIGKGERFTPLNLRIIRPGGGIPPRFYETIIGKKASMNIKKGTAMSWDFIG